jgi:hypothetical protein
MDSRKHSNVAVVEQGVSDRVTKELGKDQFFCGAVLLL